MNYYTDNKKVLKHYLTHPLMKRIVAMQERDYTQAEKYKYAPVDYDEAIEGYEQVLELVGGLCAEIIAPNAMEIEKDGPTLKDGRVQYAPATEKNLDVFRS